jgi:Zn-dependent protease with chaperone function
MFSVGFLLFLAYAFVQYMMYGGTTTNPRWPFRLAILVFFVALPFLVLWTWVVGMLLRHVFAEQEYRADLESAEATGNPLALGTALLKVASGPDEQSYSMNSWLLLLDIVTHTFDKHAMARLCALHPPLSERLDRLLSLAKQGESSVADSPVSDRDATGDLAASEETGPDA